MTRDHAIFFCGIFFYPAAVLLLKVLGKPVRRHLLFVGLFFLLVALEWVGWDEKSARYWPINLVGYSGLFTFPLLGLDPKAEIDRPFPAPNRGSEKTIKLFDWIGMLVFFCGVLIVFACPAILTTALCQTPLLTCDAIKLERLHASLLPTSPCFWRFIVVALSGVLLIRQIVKVPAPLK